MPGSTTRGLHYSLGADAAATIDNTMQTLAEDVDGLDRHMTNAARLALVTSTLLDGTYVFETDTDQLWHWKNGVWKGYSPTTHAHDPAVVGCHLALTGAGMNGQSIAAGPSQSSADPDAWTGFVGIAWNSEVADPQGFHDPAVPAGITVPAGLGGTYDMDFQSTLEDTGAPSAGREVLRLYDVTDNPAFVVLAYAFWPGAIPRHAISVTGRASLAAGRLLNAQILHENTTNVARQVTGSPGGKHTFFTMRRIGP